MKSLWSSVLANKDTVLAGIHQFSTQTTSVNKDFSFDQATVTHSCFGLV